MRFLLI